MADAGVVQQLAGDTLVAATTATIPHPYPDGAAERWISGHASAFAHRRQANFAVVRADSGVLVGCVSLLDVSALSARSDLAYWVGVPYWSHGYCTEAVSRLMRFGQKEWGITRFVARCMARNTASARVMEKVGLVREGLQRAHVFKNGRYEDMLLYGWSQASRTAA